MRSRFETCSVAALQQYQPAKVLDHLDDSAESPCATELPATIDDPEESPEDKAAREAAAEQEKNKKREEAKQRAALPENQAKKWLAGRQFITSS